MKTIFMIFCVSVTTLSSQLLLKQGLLNLGVSYQSSGVVKFFWTAFRSPYVIGGLSIQVAGYLIWLLVISKEKLGYSFALSGASFYLLMALVSYLLFDEKLSLSQWAGIVMITGGVFLLASGFKN